jgi:ketosteroid isomerase-like protein
MSGALDKADPEWRRGGLFMKTRLFTASILLGVPSFASVPAVPLSNPTASWPSETAAVELMQRRFSDALTRGDAAAIARLYQPDAISLPEHQPALLGARQVEHYWATVTKRLRVLAYESVRDELIPLGDARLVEIGRFTIRWRANGGAEREEVGKFMAVYQREGDGLRLVSDVRGYFGPVADAALFHVPMALEAAPIRSTDAVLESELSALNDANANAIRTWDAEAKIALYAPDAIYWPFADQPKRGLAEIRAHYVPYTERSRGVQFESVRIWHDRATRHGEWVLENARFHVRWHPTDESQQVSGGGLRLWKRQPDGKLRMFRQIGTHDYRAAD